MRVHGKTIVQRFFLLPAKFQQKSIKIYIIFCKRNLPLYCRNFIYEIFYTAKTLVRKTDPSIIEQNIFNFMKYFFFNLNNENIMKKIRFTIVSLLLNYMNTSAQFIHFSPTSDTSAGIIAEGYIDTYFSYDFAEPPDANIPYFVSQNRHNEFNINLAYISLKYSSDKVRAVFTPGFGTYMNSNYAAERITLRNIVEGNVGIRLSSKKNIWLDAGVIGSPFTNESSISFDQLALTRSFAPEYVPYYMTGARLTLPLHKKFTAKFFLLNGWQVIEDVNTPLAFASQFEYKPADKLTLTLNTYYGNEQSANIPNNKIRTFLDFYAIYQAEKIHITLSSYIGNQKRKDNGDKVSDNAWWQVNAAARYFVNQRHSLTIRGEYFSDPKSVMIIPITPVAGFQCGSISVGYNVAITPVVLFRIEGRYFQSPDDVFIHANLPTKHHKMLTGGLTAKF